jgi:hypothetical protein
LINDLIHFAVLLISIAMIGVGLWLVSPSAMFIGVGSILFCGVIGVRIGSRVKVKPPQ